MPPNDPESGFVLRAGDATGVLIENVADESAARISAAQRGLAQATGRSDILIGLRPSGRPKLEPPYPELGVSLSYRSGLLLAAFSPSRGAGADIEIDDPALDCCALARDHYSAREAAAIAAAAGDTRRDLFLRLWVAKEAVLKITGRGIFDGLDEPDLANALDRVVCDGQSFHVAAGRRVPATEIVVRRQRAGGDTVYLTLAVEAARS